MNDSAGPSKAETIIIDTIHDESGDSNTHGPMVLIGSVLTHLFGGSAGREGVAVQMGASLADGYPID
jgi:H+/Cl- antiporter ClcA